MARRGENIYKRKDGRWEGRVLSSEGKYRYFYAKNYKNIKDKIRNFQEPIPHEQYMPNPAVNSAGLFECWLQGDIVKRVKLSTYSNYFSCIQKYVIPYFQRKENEKLTEETISQFSRYINNYPDISEAYKRKILTIFKTALKDIIKESLYLNVKKSVKLPKIETEEVQVFSVSEQRLIENIVITSENLRTLGILLTFYTGIRLGELCALKWNDFDFEANVLTINKTVTRVKNPQKDEDRTTLFVGKPKSQKSIRKIPLPTFIQNIFSEQRKCCIDGNSYVFTGTNTPIDPRTYQKLFKKILTKSNVKNRKFHAIRHTFATRALELGVDIKTLSEILGHANVTITLNIYAHSLMEQKKAAMDRFNDLHITHMTVSPFAVTENRH